MFKDILAVLTEDRGAAAAVALAIAGRFGAHVSAVAPSPDPELTAAALAELEYGAFLVGEPEREERARRRLESFAARAMAAGIAVETVAPDREDAQVPRLHQLARAFDFVVMERPEGRRAPAAGGEIGAMLIHSGRPVLAAPNIRDEPFAFDGVALAWDASASAARAMAEAMPALRRAKAVEVVTVRDAKATRGGPGGAEIVRHLARHGVAASFTELPGGADAGGLLLSHAADRGVNLVVAGAYGHTRLAEAVFGGFTRTLLESSSVPLFLSH